MIYALLPRSETGVLSTLAAFVTEESARKSLELGGEGSIVVAYDGSSLHYLMVPRSTAGAAPSVS